MDPEKTGDTMRQNQKTLLFLYRISGRAKWQIPVLLAVQILIGLCGIFYALFLRTIIDAAAGGRKEAFLAIHRPEALKICDQVVTFSEAGTVTKKRNDRRKYEISGSLCMGTASGGPL